MDFHRFDRLNVRLRLNAFSAGGTDTGSVIVDIHYVSAAFWQIWVIRRVVPVIIHWFAWVIGSYR